MKISQKKLEEILDYQKVAEKFEKIYKKDGALISAATMRGRIQAINVVAEILNIRLEQK